MPSYLIKLILNNIDKNQKQVLQEAERRRMLQFQVSENLFIRRTRKAMRAPSRILMESMS